jgi:hypothetical protein
MKMGKKNETDLVDTDATINQKSPDSTRSEVDDYDASSVPDQVAGGRALLLWNGGSGTNNGKFQGKPPLKV